MSMNRAELKNHDSARDWMSGSVKPMQATLTKEPFDSPDYYFEVKWDGVRALAFLDDGTRLQSRNLNIITHQYPELTPLHKLIGGRQAILDGEIVVLDPLGRSNFELIQQRLNLSRPSEIEHASRILPVVYYAFDLLFLDGEPIIGLPLMERKQILRELINDEKTLRFSQFVEGDGMLFFEAATAQGLEGVVAKKMRSTYQIGRRSRDWLKIKHTQRQSFVIGGWTAGEGARRSTLGALMLGVYEGDELRFCGHVGTGFDQRKMTEIMESVNDREVENSPFNSLPPSKTASHWIKPELVCEVEFSQWTSEGYLRGPSYAGLRWDKAPKECKRQMGQGRR